MSKRYDSEDWADWARWVREGAANVRRGGALKSPYPKDSVADECWRRGRYGNMDTRAKDEAVAAAQREGEKRLAARTKAMGLEPVSTERKARDGEDSSEEVPGRMV